MPKDRRDPGAAFEDDLRRAEAMQRVEELRPKLAERAAEQKAAKAKKKAAAKPQKADLVAPDVLAIRGGLKTLYAAEDETGRVPASAQWGIYAFYDYDGEPIYVGQTYERLSGRVGRHMTNQRTDAVAMRVLDPFEVYSVELWPLYEFEGIKKRNARRAEFPAAKAALDAYEYAAYVGAIEGSRFKAILNEKIPPPIDPLPALPPSVREIIIPEEIRAERAHADVRIERRAVNLSRVAQVARERGEVTEGLRRVLVIQAVRLAYLASARLAEAQGRDPTDASAIDVEALVGGPLLVPSDDEGIDEDDESDATDVVGE